MKIKNKINGKEISITADKFNRLDTRQKQNFIVIDPNDAQPADQVVENEVQKIPATKKVPDKK